MELCDVQGVWKDTKGRCLIRIVKVAEPTLLRADDTFYADIQIVQGNFFDATSYYESVFPKRPDAVLQIKGEQISTEDGKPVRKWKTSHRVVKCALTYRAQNERAPANRSRSG